jgi:hypothetical protein
MKIMAGLLKPNDGEVLIDGIDITTNPTEAKNKIGYIPDHPYLYDKITGWEFLQFTGGLHGLEPAALSSSAEELLDYFSLSEDAHQLIGAYSHGMRQRLAFFQAQTLADRPGGDIAHHDLDRHDLDLTHQLLAHVQAADEVRGDADMRKPREHIFADAVVDHALAVDRALFLGVERGGIILEILDQRARLGTLIEDLGLAFVNLAAAGHGTYLR